MFVNWLAASDFGSRPFSELRSISSGDSGLYITSLSYEPASFFFSSSRLRRQAARLSSKRVFPFSSLYRSSWYVTGMNNPTRFFAPGFHTLGMDAMSYASGSSKIFFGCRIVSMLPEVPRYTQEPTFVDLPTCTESLLDACTESAFLRKPNSSTYIRRKRSPAPMVCLSAVSATNCMVLPTCSTTPPCPLFICSNIPPTSQVP